MNTFNRSLDDTSNRSGIAVGHYTDGERLLYGCLGLLLSAFITVVNSVIMWAFIRSPNVRRVPGHVLIVGLMVSSDILIGAGALPGYLAATLFDSWPLPMWVCDLWITCDYVSTNVGVVSVTAVAFDRFLATNCVFAHKRWMHRANQIRLCIGLWIFTAVRNILTFPVWVVATNYRAISDPKTCSHPIYKNPTAALVQRTLALYIPVILLVFFYSAVVMRILRSGRDRSAAAGGCGARTLLRRHVQNQPKAAKPSKGSGFLSPKPVLQAKISCGQTSQSNESDSSSTGLRLHRSGTAIRRQTVAGRLSKSFRIVTCVLVSFLLANLPWHILDNMIMMKKTDILKTDSIYILSWIMCYMNAFLNPFFYLFMNDEYKKVLIGVFRCQGMARRNEALVQLRGLMSSFTRANVTMPTSACDSLSDLEANNCAASSQLNVKPLLNSSKHSSQFPDNPSILVQQYISSV